MARGKAYGITMMNSKNGMAAQKDLANSGKNMPNRQGHS